MRSTVNLHILHREFASLAESAYFDNGFKQFSAKTLDAIDHVLGNVALYPDDIIRAFERHLWNARKFVKGSRASDTPYEVQSALRVALKHWMKADALISNAELEDISFFLNLLDLWGFIKTALIYYDTKNYDPAVVRIGAPSVYKHRPVFCIPLFHELGHFIDLRNDISTTSMIMFQPSAIPPTDTAALQREHYHRMEHFADLFAACYCSDSLNQILVRLEGYQPSSATHPATADRLSVVDDFLAGRSNNVVDMFQTVLTVRGLPCLGQQFSIPNVEAAFDDVRTFTIADEREYFGFFPATWRYLEDQLDHRLAPWIRQDTNQLVIESTINDLTEKSLRNFEIKARWKNVTGP